MEKYDESKTIFENNEDKNFLENISLNKKKIHFCDKILIYFYESYNDSNFLTATQRLADKARLSKIIEPILTQAHRTKIRTRNFLFQAPDTPTLPPFL